MQQEMDTSETNGQEVATPRDLQRAALRSLIDLAGRCADEEQAIEQAYEQARSRAQSDLTAARMALQQQVQQQQRAVQEKYEHRTGEITARFESETREQQEALDRSRGRADLELRSAEQDIKKQYDQQAW